MPNPFDITQPIPVVTNKIMVSGDDHEVDGSHGITTYPGLEIIYAAKPEKAHKKQVTVTTDHFDKMIAEQGRIQHLTAGAIPAGGYIPAVYMVANISAIVSSPNHASGGDHRREVVKFPVKIPGRFYGHSAELPHGQNHVEHHLYNYLASPEGIEWFTRALKKETNGVDGRKVYGFTIDIAQNKSMCDSTGSNPYYEKASCSQRMLHYQNTQGSGPLKYLADKLIAEGYTVSNKGLRVTTRTAERETVSEVKTSSWGISSESAIKARTPLPRWGQSMQHPSSRNAILEARVQWSRNTKSLPDMAGRTAFITQNGHRLDPVGGGFSPLRVLHDRFNHLLNQYKEGKTDENKEKLAEYCGHTWKDITTEKPLSEITDAGYMHCFFSTLSANGVNMGEINDAGENLLLQAAKKGRRKTCKKLVDILDPRVADTELLTPSDHVQKQIDIITAKGDTATQKELDSKNQWQTLIARMNKRSVALDAGEGSVQAPYDNSISF